MATWQAAFDLLPREAAFAAVPDPREVPSTLPVSHIELDELLPRGISWHPELAVWGSENSNCILLWTDTGRVSSLSVRFDLREPSRSLFEGLLQLAQRHNLALYFAEGRKVVEPERAALLAVLKSSTAAQFAQDPVAFIRSLG